MAYVLTSLCNAYKYFFTEFEDPRVVHYPLIGSPVPVFGVIFLYLFFALQWGPNWMEYRKPYNLRTWIIVYNFLQVVFNVIIWITALWNSYLQKDFSWICQPCDHSNNEPYMKNLIFVSYLYYLTKYLDLLDTVFFVLRKKNSHLTFLHVYHHAGMIFAVYIFQKFMSGSHPTMIGVINSFVHIIMYGYYFCTSYQNVKHSIWWKKHITQLQLAQFAYLVLHFTWPFINKNCTFSRYISFVGLSQNTFMFLLFSDFYYKAYVKKKN